MFLFAFKLGSSACAWRILIKAFRLLCGILHDDIRILVVLIDWNQDKKTEKSANWKYFQSLSSSLCKY